MAKIHFSYVLRMQKLHFSYVFDVQKLHFSDKRGLKSSRKSYSCCAGTSRVERHVRDVTPMR